MTPLENELDKLLGYVCKESGFCLTHENSKAILSRNSLTDFEFATAILTAEGITPPEYSQWYKPLQKRFQRHFGKRSVSVSDFKL